MNDYISQQLGNYRLIKRLGRGGFADVYLGEHVHLKTQAAVKVLHAVLGNDDIDTFRTEALTVAHLVHPHIIRVLDFDVVNAVPFLVMDYAPKGNLRERYPKGTRVPPNTLLSYVQQVASALQYAHDRNLMHRDVKPENMLIGNDNEILLSDFGTALTAHSTLSQNTENTVVGTLSYMAPEQIEGKPRPASDQYALAVVVYEWLSGNKPFRGSHVEIAAQHLSTPPPPLNDPALAIPPAVQQVIQRAMAKDYHQRFPRVQDFADALQKAYQGQQLVLPTPESPAIPPTVPANTPHTPYSPYRQPVATPGTPARQAVAPLRQPVTTPAASARPMTPIPPTSEAQVPRPVETFPIPSVKEPVRKITRGLKRGVRVLATVVILVSLLLCALGYGAFHFFTTRNTGTNTDTSGATALATNFVQAISQRNYDQAYNDLGSPIASQTSRTQFKQQAQSEDACYGTISNYQTVASTQPPKYSYILSRAKMQKTYQLNLTLQRNSAGTWQITDYQSNIDTVQASCS